MKKLNKKVVIATTVSVASMILNAACAYGPMVQENYSGSNQDASVLQGSTQEDSKDNSDVFMSYAHSLGFKWGMTSNAILITPEVANMLQRCGMNTISVSIDGVPQTHGRSHSCRYHSDRRCLWMP